MIPQCAFCKRLMVMDSRKCEAYPRIIPDAIWNGDVDHTQPYEGDQGMQFIDRGRK